MRIPVVGASGWVGSHVFHEARRQGHGVLGPFGRRALEGFVQCDFQDKARIEHILSDKPGCVICDYASEPDVGRR